MNEYDSTSSAVKKILYGLVYCYFSHAQSAQIQYNKVMNNKNLYLSQCLYLYDSCYHSTFTFISVICFSTFVCDGLSGKELFSLPLSRVTDFCYSPKNNFICTWQPYVGWFYNITLHSPLYSIAYAKLDCL